MMKPENYKGLWIMFVLILLNISSFAQPDTLLLWPEGVPNQYETAVGEKLRVAADSVTITHVSEVTSPTLIVYPAKNVAQGQKSKAVIICPGGGYTNLSIEKEGHKVAQYLSENGITGIILKYRLPLDKYQPQKQLAPIQDARQAIRMVRANAESWGIDSEKIGIMGFSAGGHLAATASTRRPYFDVEGENLRPDFSILIYPVISMKIGLTHLGSHNNLLGKNASDELVNEFSNELQVSEQTPPTFLVHALDDRAVPVDNTLQYLQKLRDNKIQCEAHLLKKGGHGFGMNHGYTDEWPTLMIRWINDL